MTIIRTKGDLQSIQFTVLLRQESLLSTRRSLFSPTELRHPNSRPHMASGSAASKPSINLNEKLPSEDDLQTLNSPTVTAPTSSKTAGAATTVELHAASTVPVNDISRRMRRAERFGLPVQLSAEEKRNSRAERFGSASGPNKSDVVNKSEDLKRKARAERFGMQVPSMTADEVAKKKARSARFSAGLKTDPQEEDKRKLRAIRFSDIPSSWNGKAAISGKASGLA